MLCLVSLARGPPDTAGGAAGPAGIMADVGSHKWVSGANPGSYKGQTDVA